MNGFKPSALRVNDKVGIRRSGMFQRVHDLGTVSKVTATQLTVTLDKGGATIRFMRDSGREYGSAAFNPAHLVTISEAEKANALEAPREKRRVTLYKLNDRLKGAGADTFTQRQLDAAMMALGDVKGGLLPPVRTDSTATYPSSDPVLVNVKGYGMSIGRYIPSLEEWRINHVGTNSAQVIEWWPLPGGES